MLSAGIGVSKKAMTAGDDEMVEGSVSSVLVDSLESNQSRDALSPEDVAWVDSCLVKDSEISDGDWSSLKDVLLEILSLQPDSHDSSEPGSNDFPGDTDIQMIPSSEARTLQHSRETDIEVVPNNKETETKGNVFPIEGETGVSSPELVQGDLSETSIKNAFSPNYKEDNDPRTSFPVDSELDMGFSASEIEPSTEDIFMVWDLSIPDEEDELVTQLNKALSQSPAQSTASTYDDSGVWKDESVDTLINGIADLSLTKR